VAVEADAIDTTGRVRKWQCKWSADADTVLNIATGFPDENKEDLVVILTPLHEKFHVQNIVWNTPVAQPDGTIQLEKTNTVADSGVDAYTCLVTVSYGYLS